MEEQTRYKEWLVFVQSNLHRLKKTGVTRQHIWEEYQSSIEQGYARTQFNHHLASYLGKRNLSMHLSHKPAEELFVDYCGDKLYWINQVTGQREALEVLVCTLGHSQYTYAKVMPSQKQGDFIDGLTRTLDFLGGVPELLIPDNLKSAVETPDRYEPKLNEQLRRWALHYGIQIAPARVRKPQDKALVEGAVTQVYRWIHAHLNEKSFPSIKALQQEVEERLSLMNQKPFQKKEGSRAIYFSQERPLLSALPAMPYALYEQTRQRIPRHYHVYLKADHTYYSVPHAYTGKKVKLIYSNDHLEIYYHMDRIALHKRSKGKEEKWISLSEHAPQSHQKQKNRWEEAPALARASAEKIGESALAFVEALLKGNKHPRILGQRCEGICKLFGLYPADQVQQACVHALRFGALSYKELRMILEEKHYASATSLPTTPLPVHSNIRGAGYYQMAASISLTL
jgi:transposase